jgi:hypothetical protein
VFTITRSGFLHCSRESLMVYKKPPHVLILHRPRSTTTNDVDPCSGEPMLVVYRNDWSSRAVETRLDPTSTLPLNQFHKWWSYLLCPRLQRAPRLINRVPGDPWGLSSIGWVGGHHGFMRALKRESRENELTCIALATARSFSRWRKLGLGEIRN